ncbi:MAG: YafY family transcriptional regulator [Pseudomonadales bacterium]|nr:YafY family transcriptional regulator [Pseudomonadales bacterium]NRA15857.1 YafY family transcriptional regulator [Oceanospirillaceae bacterium]
MRKAERLFQLLTLLRGRRTVITARSLAESLQVSERTIYRDMQALTLSGIPIEGEAGVGYRLKPGFSIPPIMFNAQELEALQLGARMVQRWADDELGAAADSALTKIRAILPDRLHFEHTLKPEWMLVPEYSSGENARFGEQIRAAIKQQKILKIQYKTGEDRQSTREIWPLGLVFWGNVWTLVSWCELRSDYRSFRLDRIMQLETTAKDYPHSEEINLQHYIKQAG